MYYIDEPVLNVEGYESVKELYRQAQELNKLGLTQLSQDIAYLCTWMISPTWNDTGEHIGPVPLGDNTVDEKSGNCPIPYTKDLASQLVSLSDNPKALAVVNACYTQMKTVIAESGDDELASSVLNSYVSHIGDVIEDLGGEVPEDNSDDSNEDSNSNLLVIGGTLAVTSEGETTVLCKNWIGSLSRNITLESAMVTTGTIEKYTLPEPEGIIIGETTTVPDGTTGLYSDWYWSIGNNILSDTRIDQGLYFPDDVVPTYQSLDASVPQRDLEDVILCLYDNSSNLVHKYNFSGTDWVVSVGGIGIGGLPNLYFDNGVSPAISTFEDQINQNGCAWAVLPADGGLSLPKQRYSIPNSGGAGNLYSISGTTITWNTTHKLYNVLQGKTAYTTQED